MKRLIFSVTATLVALGWCASGPALGEGFITGNLLWQVCSSSHVACIAYVEGVVDATLLGRAGAFCLPVDVMPAQVVDISTGYLRDHPERRHLDAASLVTDAIRQKFPCT